MTRIDPKQLLSTLSVLLASDGGIKSALEVPRIVQLMQKFSKKLVSKCIYIHILRSSTPELLEQFLSAKGWDLLNAWFREALRTGNYYLCGDLVKLFALCPMSPARLKENPSQNQAPKLIRQLSCDPRIEAEIRNLSLQVLQQWTRVSSEPSMAMTPSPSPPRNQSPIDLYPIPDVDDDYSEDYVPPSTKSRQKPRPPKEKKAKPKPLSAKPTKQSKSRIIASEDESEEDEGPRAPKIARLEPAMKPGGEAAKTVDAVKERPLTAKQIRQQIQEEDSDVEDLLGTDSEDDRDKKQPVKPVKPVQKLFKQILDLKKPASQDRDKQDRVKDKEKLERERLREREKRRLADREKRLERAKPYSRAELRMELETDEKDKIKRIAAQLKEQNKGKSVVEKMARIPKLPKKEPAPTSKGNSFDSVLGAMDSKPKVVRTSLTKNKNRDLLNTLSGSTTEKPRSKVEVEKKMAEKEKQIRELHSKEEKEKKEREAKEQKEREEKEAKEAALEADQLAKEAELEKELKAKIEREKEETTKAANTDKRSEDESDEGQENEEGEKRRAAEKEKRREDRKRKEREEKKKSSSSAEKTSKPADKIKDKVRRGSLERRDSNSSDSGKEKGSSESSKEKSTVSSKDRKERDSKLKSESKTKADSKVNPKPAEKRPAEESPKVNKKYKESSMFGDMLTSIMKDDKPRVKKRRLSDIKAEKEAKELAAKKEREEKEAKKKEAQENSHSPTTVPENKENESEPSGGDSLTPDEKNREVKGILVYARGANKAKKKIKWQIEPKLVQVEYFEVDETERVNVWRQKFSFAEMRKSETVMESRKIKSGGAGLSDEAEERPWQFVPLDYEHPIDYGAESKEKSVQEARESTVLRPLFFDNKLPEDPSEPEPAAKSDSKPRPIPQIDLQAENPEDSLKDFSAEPWPGVMKAASSPPHAVAEKAGASEAAAAPIAGATPASNKIQDILSNFQPGFLENIVNLANNFSSLPTPVSAAHPATTTTPPPSSATSTTLPAPVSASLPAPVSATLPAPVSATVLPTPVSAALPAPVSAALPQVVRGNFSQPPPNLQPPQIKGNNPNHHHDINHQEYTDNASNDQAYDGHHHNHNNHHNDYNRRFNHERGFDHRGGGGQKKFRGRGGNGRRGRGGGGGPYNNRPKGVCFAWEERGACSKGDNCNFSHPPRY